MVYDNNIEEVKLNLYLLPTQYLDYPIFFKILLVSLNYRNHNEEISFIIDMYVLGS